jgi:hypothetical protein
MTKLKADLFALKGMAGLNLALTIVVLLKVFVP